MPLASDLMGAIHISIFVHARLFFAVSCVETSFVPCGFGGVMFNKGAVAVTFKVYGTTFCFLSNHFAAHQRKVLKRHADFQRINAEMFSVHDSMKHQVSEGPLPPPSPLSLPPLPSPPPNDDGENDDDHHHHHYNAQHHPTPLLAVLAAGDG